ncbi:MAG: DegV family EDD domain-containing protein [Lachnospiraceae bacterium]|nr:DegV family EDD domain-containing protein [Lachnospiraceae bacterium]
MIKRWLLSIMDHSLSLQERLYRLISSIGVLALISAFMVSFLLGEDKESVITLGIAALLVGGLCALSVYTRRIQLGAAVTGFFILNIILPLIYFLGGGMYGGAPIWFVLGFTYVCLMVEGRLKWYMIALGATEVLAVYYYSYRFPHMISPHTINAAYVDSAVALILVSSLICLLLTFQNKVYRSENELAQQQKKEIEELNQAQNRFFSSMSHEIRTPINTIIGLDEMILRDAISPEVAEDAKNIQGASKMLLALINDILDMSKMQSGKMDIVPVAYEVTTMLSEIVNMVWMRAEKKGLSFHMDVDSSLPSQLFGDEVRIKQVLVNVLNNAIKYTNSGSVTLSIHCEKLSTNRVLVTYSIADTGMGIKKENIPYLFDAFKRVDQEKNRLIEGTGLGLSIVKQIVDLMGGEITVNSIYTRGSTFIIKLAQDVVDARQIGALSLESMHVMSKQEHYRQSFEAPGARILIVDDNEANLMVAAKLLRETKIQIDTVTSGEECLQKTLGTHYNGIFMDHLMPEMDGIECLHAIREQVGGLNRETPVVALTANAGSDNQALYRNEGFDGYILKPVSGTLLEASVLKLLPKDLIISRSGAAEEAMAREILEEHRAKVPILITTDSVCDLPDAVLSRLDIPVLPYRVVTNRGVFLDGVETESDGILVYMKDPSNKVHSEPPDVASYEDFFAANLVNAENIIHITIAKKASEGYRNALEAAETFDNVTVVDSGHLSSGMGLMVLYARKLSSEKKTVEEIVSSLEEMRDKVRTSFIVDDTEFLARAGRLPNRIHTVCRILMLHPIIILKRSKLTVGGIRIGRRVKFRKEYISKALEALGTIDDSTLFITYTGLSQQDLQEIRAEVIKKAAFKEIIFQKASPSISANCGPGTFGLIFARKR